MPVPVLVVDDSSMSRKLTIRAFPDDWDAEISQASGGQEALDSIERGLGHVVFLDLTMPGMSGFDVLAEIRRRGLDCFTIVVSADVQPKAEEQARQLGAMAFVRKPVKADELHGVLREYGFL